MSFHTVGFGFRDVVSPPNHFPQSTFAPLPAFADSFFSLAAPAGGTSTAFLMPADMKLIMAFAISPTLFQARINAPSFNRVSLPLIRPLEQNPTPPGDPNVMWGRLGEAVLPPGEPVGVDAKVGAANEPAIFSMLWFAHKELRPVPPGDAFWVSYVIKDDNFQGEGESMPAFQWVQMKIAFEQTLPSGTYAVIGFEHHGSDAIAARLVFPGSPFRPGTVATADQGQRTFDRFYDGSLGTYGIFRTSSLPSIEVVRSVSEEPDQDTGHLRLIRVGGLASDFQPHQLHKLVEHRAEESKPGASSMPHGLFAPMHEAHKEPGT